MGEGSVVSCRPRKSGLEHLADGAILGNLQQASLLIDKPHPLSIGIITDTLGR